MKSNRYYYLFDSHSRDKNGKVTVDGASILLKFWKDCEICNYIASTYLIESGHIELFMEM